jgi:glycosyltransferase involved in cell wall biosynthesis
MNKQNLKRKLLIVSLSNNQNMSVRRHLHNYLKSKFNEIVIVGEGDAEDDFNYINWKYSSKRSIWHSVVSLFRLVLIFYSSRPSHVISFSPKANLYCNLLQKLFGYKHCSVVTGLGEMIGVLSTSGFLANTISNIIYPKHSFWITMNSGDAAILGERRGVFKKIYDIPGEGYSIKFTEENYLNRRRTLDVVYIGRVIESKGVIEFLEAIKILRNRGIHLNVAIVGSVDLSKFYLNKFILLVKELNISKYGYLPEEEKNKILVNSKVLVLTTKYGEGLPFILLEAQDAGCSIVTSTHPGCIRALSLDKVDCISEAIPEAIANIIPRALNKFDYMTPDEISHSREWILAKNSLDATLRSYEKIFTEVQFY